VDSPICGECLSHTLTLEMDEVRHSSVVYLHLLKHDGRRMLRLIGMSESSLL